MVLQSVQCFVRALQRVAQYVGVDLLSMVRRHLLELGWHSHSLQSLMNDPNAKRRCVAGWTRMIAGWTWMGVLGTACMLM
jgi:hypothetical protein